MSFVFFMAIANLRLLMPFRNFSIVANPAGLNPSGLKCSDTQSLWTQALWTQSLRTQVLRRSSALTLNPSDAQTL